MTMETALRGRLLAAAPVKAIADTRVDWVNRPQGAGGDKRHPSVVLSVIYDPRPKTMTGRTAYRGVRVQIDCRAETLPEKVALRNAVLDAIEAPGRFDEVRFGRPKDVTIRDRGEDSTGNFIHRDSIDAVIWNDG